MPCDGSRQHTDATWRNCETPPPVARVRRTLGIDATINDMLLMVHPTGNANVRQALQAFTEISLLAEFHTAISFRQGGVLDRVAPPRFRAELRRRAFPESVQPFIRVHPCHELGRLVCQAMGWNHPLAHERGIFSVDSVYRDLDRRVARRLGAANKLTGVYGYEDGVADSFVAARKVGLRTIYDLPIGHWRAAQRTFREEVEREPEWAATLTGRLDSAEKLQRKDLELKCADVVIVASAFTRATLAGALEPKTPVFVVPYGAPAVCSTERPATRPDRPLRVLFAGTLTQRKGVSYFLKACGLLSDAVEVTIIGRKQGGPCAPLEAALRRYRYIPSVPHQEMLAEMGRQDVLVFPSLFEGFGLVILEAMAQGVPVITTTATGGPDVITDGSDGFIVPLRDAEAIATRLEFLIRDRERLRAMSAAARQKAASLRWSHYRSQLATAVTNALSPRPYGSATAP
jgi:starch synthase